MSNVLEALEYLDRGWAVVPVPPGAKSPSVKWREFQTRLPTIEEVEEWWALHPDAFVGVVTGAVSGIVVVDCDTPEAAERAKREGLTSPISVTTKHGIHYYHRHPRDGSWRGPRVGANSARSTDWPYQPGLDFRGDGSIVVVPPSKGYAWAVAESFDRDDDGDYPIWRSWQPPVPEGEFDFRKLDLSGVTAVTDREARARQTEWERTKTYVEDNFPATKRLPTGGGHARNERVMRHASDMVRQGVFGAELIAACESFMEAFFEDHLPAREVEATAKSMEDAERRNHPEKFDADGNWVAPAPASHEAAKAEAVEAAKAIPPVPFKLVHNRDAERLLEELGDQTYLIRPWLPRASVTHVFGYTGHGKSVFVGQAMTALACGRDFGGFDIDQPAKVLYFDFENGRGVFARRQLEMRHGIGDPGDDLLYWLGAIEGSLHLNTDEGKLRFLGMIRYAKPDVAVIDTVRTAFPGLEESKAEAWAPVNKMLEWLVSQGIAVVLVHHANKPGENSLGYEAGSTAQLNLVSNQIRVEKVVEDQELAKEKRYGWDKPKAQFDEREITATAFLSRQIASEEYITDVMRVTYGKVREFTDEHEDPMFMARVMNRTTGKARPLWTRSIVERARSAAKTRTVEQVAEILKKPRSVVEAWVTRGTTSLR